MNHTFLGHIYCAAHPENGAWGSSSPELLLIRCTCRRTLADFRPPVLQVKQRIGRDRLRQHITSSAVQSTSVEGEGEDSEYIDIDVQAENDLAPLPPRRPTQTFQRRALMALSVSASRRHRGPNLPPRSPQLGQRGRQNASLPVSPRVPPRTLAPATDTAPPRPTSPKPQRSQLVLAP